MCDEEDDNSIKLCRLYSVLNDSCLIEVFLFLNFVDLLAVAQMCDRFLRLIAQHVIPHKWIDIEGLASCAWASTHFAPFVRKAIVTFGEFQKINDLLGNITHLEMKRSSCCFAVEDDLKLSDLRELNVALVHRVHETNLKNLLMKVTALQTLHISVRFSFVCDWLANCTQLKHLHLTIINSDSDQNQTQTIHNAGALIKANKGLRTFSFHGDVDIASVYPLLFENCQQLEHFSDFFKSERPHRWFLLKSPLIHR